MPESVLQELLTTNVFAWMLIFTRVGSAFIVLPGVGEAFVPSRIRLLFALTVSALLVPVIGPKLPAMPAQVLDLLALIAGEAFYGLFIGIVARLIMSTVETAGMIIAMQISLSNASVFNPAMAAQSSLTSALLGVAALALMFAADLHHLLLWAVADSYTVFTPGTFPQMGDHATTYARLLGQSFGVATQLSAPFLVLGLVFYLGLGLLARLMPQLQIFFIAIPAQIYLGLIILGLTLSTMMMVWLNYARFTINALMGVE